MVQYSRMSVLQKNNYDTSHMLIKIAPGSTARRA